MPRRTARLLGPAVLVVVAVGCTKPPSGPPPQQQSVVPVAHPVQRDVTESVEYTGRTDAVQSVGIKARATGYLTRADFGEGGMVKAGDVLFEIDPRPYRAQLDQAEGQVKVAEAQFALAQANYGRIKGISGTGASQQEVDTAKSAADAADAQVKAAKATAEVYRLNLEYTKVRSPIDGQASRYFYTLGNLVGQDQTLLATVVSVSPMYAYFDIDERTDQRLREAVNRGRVTAGGVPSQLPLAAGTGGLVGGSFAAANPLTANGQPVFMWLEGEKEAYTHRGVVNFASNVFNPSTGTRAYRGVFDNPTPPGGLRLLTPGRFVRIRMPLGDARPSLLVVDRAIGSDQGLKYVYVIDADRKVRYRRVKVGPLEDDGLRVVEEGLKADDVVAVGAIQQLKPGMDVDTEEIAMPAPGAPSNGGTGSGGTPPAGGNQPAGRTSQPAPDATPKG